MVSELLKKAEILTEHDPKSKAVTYNNFACFSRQQGRLHASLAYLQKALGIEKRLMHVDNPADTHLNLCAVLSQLGRHREALEHSQQALMLLQEELFAEGAAERAAQKPDRIAVLAICYHNIGVECEFLKHQTASLQAYTKGVEIASVYLGATHGITQTLERSQGAALAAIQKHEEGRRGRRGRSPAGGAGGPASFSRGAASRSRPGKGPTAVVAGSGGGSYRATDGGAAAAAGSTSAGGWVDGLSEEAAFGAAASSGGYSGSMGGATGGLGRSAASTGSRGALRAAGSHAIASR